MNWFKRTPKLPWVYLGWTEIEYTDPDGTTNTKCALQFYARGPNYTERKCEHPGWTTLYAERHGYWQKFVIPWIGGNNLYDPIGKPSDNLKAIAAKIGYSFVAGKWVKPAPKYEKTDNVLTFKGSK